MRPRQAGRPSLINLKMKHCPGCAIDVSYMRWQIQAIPCVPSVIISLSPGTNQDIHWRPAMWNAWGRERDRDGASQADRSHGWRFILVNHPSALGLAELMAHKHTWLHKGGETDWRDNSIAPGECNFNKSFPHRRKTKLYQRLVHDWKLDISNINIHNIWRTSCISTDSITLSCTYKNLKSNKWQEPSGCSYSHKGAKCLQCSYGTVLTFKNSLVFK